MPKKDEVPDHVVKYRKLDKKVEAMIHTLERGHRQAYTAGEEALIGDDGKVNLDLLNDSPKHQQDMAQRMADHYLSIGDKILRQGKGADKLDEAEKEMLRYAVSGTTYSQLVQHVRTLGKDFTFETFYTKVRPKMMEAINNNLRASKFSHFSEEHIPEIVKYTGAHWVDPKKMKLEDALELLAEREATGTLSPKKHKRELYYRQEAA